MSRRTYTRTFTLPAIALLLAAGIAQAQQPAPATAPAGPIGPQVGDVAPDFTLPTATKEGLGKKPLRLSDLKGQTVVIAFFPRSRTSGCTAQMENYRDRYATIFNDGKGVVVLAVSTDPDTMQMAWAQEKSLPVTFVSDTAGVLGKPYEVLIERNGAKFYRRVLYVVGPDGKISHVMRPFRELTDEAYAELGDAVKKAKGG